MCKHRDYDEPCKPVEYITEEELVLAQPGDILIAHYANRDELVEVITTLILKLRQMKETS